MASLTTPSSPTSLQLRFGQRYRGSGNQLLKMRFQPSDLRVRVVLHSRPLDGAGVKVRSRNSSSGPLDAFSGWSESDGGEADKKGSLGGIIGATLAGGLFLASITFAALSFTGKSTNGMKVQMQPLTSEQTALIRSNDTSKIDKINKDLNEDNSKKEKFDSSVENMIEEIENTESKVYSSKENTSDQETEASKHDLDTADSSVIEEDKPMVLDANGMAPKTTHPDSEKILVNQPEEDIYPEETLNAPAMADPLPVEIVASEVVILESGDVVETQEVIKEVVSLDQQETTDSSNQIDPLQETELMDIEKQGGLNNKVEKSETSFKKEGSFSRAGIPAPSLVSAALQVPPGNVLVLPIVDQSQSQAFAAFQALKVIEGNAKPDELCTRREYARWLVAASSLSRNTVSKVYPAMYIENVTELAFDDVTADDPDFSCIQGLAEAGLISSKLSRPQLAISDNEEQDKILFFPESPLSRQDLVTWKMALEKRYLPEIDKNAFYKASGYIDIDKIHPDAWPALVADLATGEQSITALAFGYTRLFQPGKPVTKAQAAIALSTGESYEVVNEELARIEAETLAESAVNAHTALVAQVEKDLNAAYENDLAREREKIETLEKLAEAARLELKKLKAKREEEDNTIIMGRAAVESEMEVLLKLKHDMEKEMEGVMSKKMEVSFERERINKLRQEIENENQSIAQLKYDLEVERKALAMARAWAEEEAKRAREQARALEEARSHWEQRGIKVVVDEEFQDDSSAGISWLAAGETSPVETKLKFGVSVQEKVKQKIEMLKANIAQKRVEIIAAFERLREKILSLVAVLKEQAAESSKRGAEFWAGVSCKAKRVIEDCKEGLEKITQKPKS